MEMILFTGIQAAGKSEFYKQNFYKTHIRINLDMLKTRNREKILMTACLEAKQPFVVDNTNPTMKERNAYIRLAKEYGFTVTGYYFRSEINGAITRNESRTGKEKVPVPAILGTYKRLELPDYTEGFDRLYYVSPQPDFHFLVEDYKNEV